MNLIRVICCALALSAAGLPADAQAPEQPPSGSQPPAPEQGPASPADAQPPAPVEAEQPQPQEFQEFRYARPALRIGTPYTLGANGQVGDVVVVMGDATVSGDVLGDLVVVLGDVRLGATAAVEGSVVVVGGNVTVETGSSINRDFVVVAGAVAAPAGFMPGGEHIVIGPPALGDAMRELVPWFTRGLLWGRVIVPDLPWVWFLVFVSLLLYVALALAFPAAVRACAETLTARPLASFLVGLLTLLLIGPITTILAISVVGIVIIPFAVCAVIVAWFVGKAAVARWLGAGVVHQDEPDDRVQTIRSILIGFAIICIAYMIPLLGVTTWALAGVLGLGTAALTVIAGLKRERPEPPTQPIPPGPEFVTPAPAGGAPAAFAEATPPSSAPSAFTEPQPALDRASAAAMPGAPVLTAAPGAAVPPGSRTTADGSVDLTTFPRARFLDRLAAAVLDVLLVLIATNLLTWWGDDGLFFLLLFGYHVAFWTWKGTTLGGIICNLRLVRTDGSALRPADSLVRGLASLFSIAALGLGFLWILRDPERQAWHDRIAGTYVVSVPRNWPLP